MKKHTGVIVFFSFIIFVFLGDLIFMKSAFIDGDYLTQFYPWSKIYSQTVKNFHFPFWTRYFHSGFPLMAEGQVGGFYPLNFIMFFLLPFHLAYNYSVIIHFILAGIFTYIYTRKIGAEQWGGLLSALLFCFGSNYAGCFYNTVTLKALAWFPLVLFLFEKYFENKKIKYLFFAGIVLGMQLLAGFTQMAVYSAIFYAIYFFYGLVLAKKIKISDIVGMAIVLLIAGIIFFPQFALSYQLLRLSMRMDTSLGFALWGSFLPLNLMSICFPYSIFYGARFYIGVVSILFVIVALFRIKSEPRIRQLVLMLFLAIFLALGAYNPLYVFFLKAFKLFGFRNPSKFIFFGVFSACVLAGRGFTLFFAKDNENIKKKGLQTFAIFIGLMLSLFSITKLALEIFKDKIINFGERYVMNYVAGKSYHRYGLTTYMERVRDFYESLLKNSSLENIFVFSSVVFCLYALAMCAYLFKRNKVPAVYKAIFVGVVFLDLFIFSSYGTGFKGNIKPFTYLNPSCDKILGTLKSDNELFRVMPFDLLARDMPQWAKPNTNALYGIDSVAAYTPLVQKDYKEALLSLEVIDDSLGLIAPADESLAEKKEILKLLNVKYIISSRRLNFNFIEEVISENGVYLYKLTDFLPRIFFTTDVKGNIKRETCKILEVIEYKDGFAKVNVSTNKPGFLVFSENFYPGWHAYIDGIDKELIKVKGLIQAVAIDKGNHAVTFEYRVDLFL